MAPRPTDTTPPIPPTTVPARKGRPSWAGGTVSSTTPIPTPTPTTVPTTVPSAARKGRPSWAGGITTAGGTISTTQSLQAEDAKIKAQDARLNAQTAGVPEEQLEEVDKGILGTVFGAANSVLNFKIPGTKIRPVYLPFYPVDKILEIEQFIPGIINQVQNAAEGKPVDVGSFTDPFGEKGILTEAGRALRNAPRRTELFQGAQEQRGYGQVVDNKALALALDIFAMPTTYLSGGGTGISKGFLKGIASGGLKTAVSETGEALTKAGAKKLAAEEAANLAKQEALKLADDVAKGIATKEAKAAADAAAAAAERRLAKANAAVAAQEANPELLFREAEKYAKTRAPRRVYGARSREDLAATAVDIAETAAKTLEDVQSGVLRLSPQDLRRVQSLDALLNQTPGVLDDIITKGYAGIRGDVAQSLYTQGGFRLGVGKLKTPVFGEKVSDILGTGISTLRVGTGAAPTGARGIAGLLETGFARSEAGKALVEWATPLGRKGFAGESDIRALRSQLRTGALTGDKARQAVRILAVDRAYRRALAETTQQLDFVASPAFANQADRVYSRSVEDLIADPRIDLATDTAASASAKLGRPVAEQELAFATRVKSSLDGLYDAANDVYREVQMLGGVPFERLKDLPRNPNFYPHVLSDKAIDYLRRTKSTEFDELMGFDRTLLGQLSTPRRWTVNQRIGNYRLTAQDIAAGTKRLNEIVREQYRINFDWFATDIGEALANQVDNVASDIAFLRTIRQQLAGGERGLITAKGLEEFADTPFITDFAAQIEGALTPENIIKINSIPEARGALEEVLDDLVSLRTQVADTNNTLLADAVEDAVVQIGLKVRALDELADTVPTSMAAALTTEADAMSTLLAAEARAAKSAIDVRPITDFKRFKAVLEDGFVELNRKILPGVQAQPELAAMLQNFRRLDDPTFLRLFNKYVGKFNRFFKAWVTATPGFHVRNAYSNAFFMTAAGANMNNILDGIDIYNNWLKYLSKTTGEAVETAAAGIPITPTLIDDFVNTTYPNILAGQRDRIVTALENVGASGFGRVEEVFSGGRQGFRGLGVTGAPAANRLSEVLGKPLTWSRQAGNSVENYTRFLLTYDGVAKGLTAEQAAARTAKYLIDYSDISRADEVLRQIIPFWMWMSRATPLMVEILTTNPKAYIIYKKLSKGLEDEEGRSSYVPSWMQVGGAFKAPFNLGGSTYLMPDLGLTGLSEDLGAFTSPAGLLGALNPIIKTPLEVWLNYDAFRKEQIANKEFDPQADAKLRKYLIKNYSVLGPVLQRYGRAGAAAAELLNADTVAEFIRDATRTGTPAFLQAPEQGGITEPTQSQNITSLLGFLGLPARNIEPYQEKNEAERRQKEYERLQRLKEIEQGVR